MQYHSMLVLPVRCQHAHSMAATHSIPASCRDKGMSDQLLAHQFERSSRAECSPVSVISKGRVSQQ